MRLGSRLNPVGLLAAALVVGRWGRGVGGSASIIRAPVLDIAESDALSDGWVLQERRHVHASAAFPSTSPPAGPPRKTRKKKMQAEVAVSLHLDVGVDAGAYEVLAAFGVQPLGMQVLTRQLLKVLQQTKV